MTDVATSVTVFWCLVLFVATSAVAWITNHQWARIAAAVMGIALSLALLIVRYGK